MKYNGVPFIIKSIYGRLDLLYTLYVYKLIDKELRGPDATYYTWNIYFISFD